jgi:hypothetical protein
MLDPSTKSKLIAATTLEAKKRPVDVAGLDLHTVLLLGRVQPVLPLPVSISGDSGKGVN